MAMNRAESVEAPISFKLDGKNYSFQRDQKVACTRGDGEPALVPAWRLKDLIMEKGFKLGYPAKKPKAAPKK